MTWEKLAEHGIKRFEPANGSIFHYTSVQAAKEILLSGQLLMSKPDKFNDPFDLNPSLLAIDTSPAEGFELEVIEMYGNERADFKGLTIQQRTELFRVERLNDQIKFLKSVISIGCFSRVNDNTLMWSHYASKHSGVCLGFNYEILYANKILVADVNYKDKVEPVNYFKDDTLGLLHWIFTKSSVWAYEKEVRAIIAEDNAYSPFPIEALTAIYYGVKTSKQDINLIEKILKAFNYQPRIKCNMRMDNETFRVKENELNYD